MLTAVLLPALAAAAQTKAELKPGPPPNFGSAHGACGPGHPYIMRQAFTIADPAPGAQLGTSVTGAARTSDLVLVGMPTGFVSGPSPAGLRVVTTATFGYPLVLKSPPGGPRNGVAAVKVRFAGGTAMLGGHCTQDLGLLGGTAPMYAGDTYLVFADLDARSETYAGGFAYLIDPKTGAVVVPPGDFLVGFPAGAKLAGTLATIRAEVTKQRAATEKRAQR
ncbi:MAG: hypothetical protein ACRD2E_05040 [Terriglobales bacterium]